MNMNLEWAGLEKLPAQRRLTVIRTLVEGQVVANWNFLIENHHCPSLRDFLKLHPSLKARPTSLETWRDIPRIMVLGWGDVKDFVCWRIAELRNAGRDEVYPYIRMADGEISILLRNQDVIENPVSEFLASGSGSLS